MVAKQRTLTWPCAQGCMCAQLMDSSCMVMKARHTSLAHSPRACALDTRAAKLANVYRITNNAQVHADTASTMKSIAAGNEP